MQLNLNNSLHSTQNLIQCIKSSLEKLCNKANKKADVIAKHKASKPKSSKN